MDEIRFRRVQSSHRNNDARKIFLFPLFYYTYVYIIRVYMYTHTCIYFFFFFTSTPSEKAHARTEERAGSLDRETSDADLYCAREVNKAERIVTAASRYIVIYLNIIFPQRIEGIIVFAHITPYYQSSLVDVLTRDLLFFTYPWFSTCRKPGFIYFFFSSSFVHVE